LISPRFGSILVSHKLFHISVGCRNTGIYLYIVLLLLSNSTSGQIIFKALTRYEIRASDSVFFDLSDTRQIIPLNGMWEVYSSEDEKINKVSVKVPSVFQGSAELIFEKSFTLTREQVANHKITLNFFGLNYSADISVNNIVIYRHPGGEFPFVVQLPRDILDANKSNLLSIKLSYKIDSKNTIPVKQQFLFPKNYGGILKDVYLHLTPNIFLTDVNFSYTLDPRSNKLQLKIDSKVENMEFKITDNQLTSREFKLRTTVLSGVTSFKAGDASFILERNEKKSLSQVVEVSNPVLWSPSNPSSYIVEFELWYGDSLIDKLKKDLAVYSFRNGGENLLLNGEPFTLKGVTYIPSFDDWGSLANYEQMEEDIKIISEAGFNSVRFAKSVPHPYYLRLCSKYGLIAFIEIPLSLIPSQIAGDQRFIERSKIFLSDFLKAYNQYFSVGAIGVGSSYLPQIESHENLVRELSALVKKQKGILCYASFADLNLKEIDNLDLYGIEFLNKNIQEDSVSYAKILDELGAGRVFVSEATYFVNLPGLSGYINQNTFDAQAKYYENLLDYFDRNTSGGFFINSIFDYRGDYSSISSGYNKNNLYRIGLLGENREKNRIAYQVVRSKIQRTEDVTIPIGTRHDDSPMIFIIFGLALALIMGVLVNSGRKFREDSSRALLRPYNFYADVRDQRIISGYHTTVLGLVSAAIAALLLSNLLFYFKEDLIFEKILLSFGSKGLMETASYLAWHPTYSVFWITIVILGLLIFLMLIIKFASFFVKTHVYLSSVYFTVIWSLLPLILLIPVGIILYRLLRADVGNTYVYLILIFFTLWIFYRLLKGIYVIFDINPGRVYLYSIVIVLAIILGVVIYNQLENNFLDYLLLTFRQYNILGF
jgi:beta-galactosidase